MKTAIHSFLLLTLIVGVIPTMGQHFPSRKYSIADGMPTNSTFDIAQDTSGMMWFMTKSGPAYYDSEQWHWFSDTLKLPTSSNAKITAIDETIWVAGLNKTTFTLQYYDGFWNKVDIPFESSLVNGHIAFNVLKAGNRYEVVIGSRNQLFIYDHTNKSWRSKEIGDLNINSIHIHQNEWIIATSTGLLKLDLDRDTVNRINIPYEKFPNQNILAIDYKDDTLFLLGYDWYAEIKANKLELIIKNIGLNRSSLNSQSSVIAHQNGMVFYGSNTFLRVIDREKRTSLIDRDNINIGGTRIFNDSEGNIWVSDSRGLFKFNVLQFLNYNKSSGLANDEVAAVKEIKNGTIILANPTSLNILKDNSLAKYDIEHDEEFTSRILDIEENTKTGQVLIAANDDGLFIYDNEDFRNPSKQINEFRVTSVEPFQNSMYISGTNGLYQITQNKLSIVDSVRGIRNMSDLDSHLALLTTSNGFFLYNSDSITHYTSPNFDLNSIYQAVRYQGSIVLATRDGLGTIDNNGNIIHWDELKINAPVYGLLLDSKERLWIGSDHGTYVYNGASLKLFGIDEGLIGNEINRNALFEDSNGRIWIGTEKGVSLYEDVENAKKPNLQVDITDVKTMQNERLDSFENNSLPYDCNNLQISFQCLSYIDEDKINFRYRIDQSPDDRWIVTDDSKNAIVFSNIQSGNYRFEIQARYGTDEWGPVTSFEFSIQKPFYFQWWFILVSIIALIVVARTIFYFRYLFLIQKQKKLKSMVAERTKEIRTLNERLEEKVLERTRELNDKNHKLEDYAYVNAHHLRAPLTKIMSAIQIMDSDHSQLTDQKLIGILKESVEEMDEVIHSINQILKT